MNKWESGLTHSNSRIRNVYEQIPNFVIETLPDYYLEQLFIMRQQIEMDLRAPGKYDKRFMGLSFLSNFNPLVRILPFIPPSGSGLYPALEVSYHWGRAVDDVVDGDMPLPNKNIPVGDWIEELKELAKNGASSVPKGITIEYMQKRALVRLEEMHSGVDIRGEMVKFLDAMKWEYERRVNRIVLTKNELEILNRNSFGPPHTITLVAVRSKARGEDIDELGQIQGRIQALRDMHTELAHGICNIPQEVLDKCGITFRELEENPSLFDSNIFFQVWKQKEIEECFVLIDRIRTKKLDKPVQLYVRYFLYEINKHLKNLNY
jgi:hypothetical protein